MKIREIKVKTWFLNNKIEAITLYPFIFYNIYSKAYKNNFKILRAHEMVHIAQVEKLGWLKFYASYLWKNITKGHDNNKYEKEAYREEHDEH